MIIKMQTIVNQQTAQRVKMCQDCSDGLCRTGLQFGILYLVWPFLPGSSCIHLVYGGLTICIFDKQIDAISRECSGFSASTYATKFTCCELPDEFV